MTLTQEQQDFSCTLKVHHDVMRDAAFVQARVWAAAGSGVAG